MPDARRPRRARTAALRLALCAGLAPAGCGGPPDDLTAEEIHAALAVAGPLTLVSDAVRAPHARSTAGRDVEIAPATPEAIERARASRAVLAQAAARARLELKGYRLEAVPEAAGWSRVAGRLRCAGVGSDGWSPLPGLEYTGRLGIEFPTPGASLELVAGDRGPLQLEAATPDGRPVPLVVESRAGGSGWWPLPADLWLERGQPGAAPPDVVRARLTAVGESGWLVGLRLGRRAPQVLARLLAGAAGRAEVCAAPLGGEPVLQPGAGAADLLIDRPEWYGAGWYGEERRAIGTVRWIGREAVLLVPSAAAGAVRLAVDAAPPAELAPPAVRVVVNGVDLGVRQTRRGFQVYDWEARAGTWLAGTNEIVLAVTAARRPTGGRDARELALALRRVRVELAPRGTRAAPAPSEFRKSPRRRAHGPAAPSPT